MKNILYCGVYDCMPPDLIRNINEKSKVKNSYLVLNPSAYRYKELYERELNAKCFCVEDAIKSKHNRIVNELKNKTKVVDDKILTEMSPYFLQILRIRQRYVKHPTYQLGEGLEENYETLIEDIIFWNSILEEGAINYAIFPNVPHQYYSNIIYYLCKIKNIHTICLTLSILPMKPRRYLIVNDFEKIEEPIREEYQKLCQFYQENEQREVELTNLIEDYFNDMSSQNFTRMKQEYTKGASMKFMFPLIMGEKSIVKYIAKSFIAVSNRYNKKIDKIQWCVRNSPRIMFTTCKLWHVFLFRKKIWRETKRLHYKYYKLSQTPKDEKYIYYAMHHVPELTSAPLGGGLYFDQKIPIRILAAALPESWKLYVKIHPTQTTNMCSEEELEKISEITKVKLIRENVDSYELICNSQAVATLTGSVAWEAQFLGIPSILFGYSEKNMAPLSYHVRTVEDCKETIDRIKTREKKTNLKELKIFTKALENISFDREDKEVLQSKLIEAIGKIESGDS